jgi:UDP-N-acetylglucosamine transferase subunit ALG13
VHWERQRGWFGNAKLVGPLFFEQESGVKVDLARPIIAVFSGRKPYQDLLDAVSYVDREIKCSWIIQTAGGDVEVENEALVRDFFVGISDLIRRADLVIATGGLTAFEALAKGKPLILYPRKGTLADHQVEQALYLSEGNRCWYVEDERELKEVLTQIFEVMGK